MSFLGCRKAPSTAGGSGGGGAAGGLDAETLRVRRALVAKLKQEVIGNS